MWKCVAAMQWVSGCLICEALKQRAPQQQKQREHAQEFLASRSRLLWPLFPLLILWPTISPAVDPHAATTVHIMEPKQASIGEHLKNILGKWWVKIITEKFLRQHRCLNCIAGNIDVVFPRGSRHHVDHNRPFYLHLRDSHMLSRFTGRPPWLSGADSYPDEIFLLVWNMPS